MVQPLAENPVLRSDSSDFESIVRHHPDSIMVLDEDGELSFINVQAKLLLNRLSGNDHRVPRALLVEAGAHDTHVLYDTSGHELRLKIQRCSIRYLGKIARLLAITDITDQSHHYRHLEKLAYADHLTGLYNRRGLELVAEDLCQLAKNEQSRLVALFIDINGLKKINDSLGHQAGDLAITSTAKLLEASFTARDIKARIGGDEFIVLMLEKNDAPLKTLLSILQRNLQRLNEDESLPFRLSISIGIARLRNDSPPDMHRLLDSADRNMYRAKHKNRNEKSGPDAEPLTSRQAGVR